MLPYEECIPLMREAMVQLSVGGTRQMLRQIIDLPKGRAFGVMPGAMLESGTFGAKLVSVFPGKVAEGGRSHQGIVALFDPEGGELAAIVDAGEITAIRTAAATAAATDALSRSDSRRLAVLGTGEQALRHVEAISRIRPIELVTIWGRSAARAETVADRLQQSGFRAEAKATVEQSVADADIICTVTGADEPILASHWVEDGAHINAVGSSRAGPSEIENALVARARMIADHREGVLAQGAEYLNARSAGLINEDHVVGEIGEVFAGRLEGRISRSDVTLYKSLGSIVQDLVAAEHVRRKLQGNWWSRGESNP